MELVTNKYFELLQYSSCYRGSVFCLILEIVEIEELEVFGVSQLRKQKLLK